MEWHNTTVRTHRFLADKNMQNTVKCNVNVSHWPPSERASVHDAPARQHRQTTRHVCSRKIHMYPHNYCMRSTRERCTQLIEFLLPIEISSPAIAAQCECWFIQRPASCATRVCVRLFACWRGLGVASQIMSHSRAFYSPNGQLIVFLCVTEKPFHTDGRRCHGDSGGIAKHDPLVTLQTFAQFEHHLRQIKIISFNCERNGSFGSSACVQGVWRHTEYFSQRLPIAWNVFSRINSEAKDH